MSIAENIKYLRKDVLRLSREKFGKKLGVSADVINNIELDRLARPEQKEPLLKLICKEFNVNYEWLTTGKGEMYTETKDDFIERLSAETGMSFYVKGLISCYMKLDDEQRAVIDGVLQTLAEMWESAPGEAESVNVVNAIDNTIYRAAKSKNNSEHKIVPDNGKILRLKELVTVDDESDL